MKTSASVKFYSAQYWKSTFKVYASELENANHADLQDYLLAKAANVTAT